MSPNLLRKRVTETLVNGVIANVTSPNSRNLTDQEG